jgi:hypothetical protein
LQIVDANNFDIIDMNILIEIGNHDIV